MTRTPEILAPAGDPTALSAALVAGADAVYFGLDEGFNARARARNFPLVELAGTVARVHRAGAKAYVTVNTLVFEPELAHVERVLRGIASAGVDAIIVQDPAVCLIAREICPALEVHASTQLTVASPSAATLAKDLGVTRVVVPRELSVDEIRKYADGTDLELEVFVHGALCMSWSGQCLTSEAWGGRSANRGQCAQSCRLPYDLVVDGRTRDLGEVRYLLSPRDLAGAEVLPDLAEIGVASFKIEGRQKSAQYVSTAVGGYRRWVDAIGDGRTKVAAEQLQSDLTSMSLTYSRGFGRGFFDGSDHQTLVDGRYPKHRGLFVGTVVAVRGDDVDVEAPTSTDGPSPADGVATELRPGMGVVFDDGHPEDKHEPGGPLFQASRIGARWRLKFGRPGPDLSRVKPGQRVWATSDPAIVRATEKAVEREPEGRVAVDVVVRGDVGGRLVVEAVCPKAPHATATVESAVDLQAARNDGLDADVLKDKLGAFGGTPLRLGAMDVSGLGKGLFLPIPELKAMRRRLVDALVPAIERGPVRTLSADGAVQRVEDRLRTIRPADVSPSDVSPSDVARSAADEPVVVPLCRSDEQLEAVIDAGLGEVELDWMELVGLGRAVARAREAGLKVTLATLRVTKPGEEPFDDRVAKLAPDALLVRHWAALERFKGKGTRLHGDFSLNVTNAITARWLLDRGLDTVTASFDLDEAQLDALVAGVPAERLTVMVYHRIPTFHTEHCVYAHLLSEGRDYRTCGRPCEKHRVSLRDVQSREHPVIVDAGCRNTVFNATTQSAAGVVPSLIARGVRRFRVQLVRETREETRKVLEAHRALIAGEASPEEVVRGLGVVPQLGVSEGMATLV